MTTDPIRFVDMQSQYASNRAAIDAALAGVIDSGAFILGPPVTELEQTLAAYAGVAHCVACASGTDALVLALQALGIGPGDEVVTTPFTWFATAEVISRVGATPVFADIDAATFNLDPAAVRGALSERTRAIMAVSLYGQPADMQSLQAIADEHGLHLIEDGAQSFGSSQHGRRSGALGRIGCTSFYPTKPLGCWGDGGAAFTDDAELADTMRALRVHGQAGPQRHVHIGLNSRLDTIQAAMLLAKFPDFDNELARRRQLAAAYDAGLAEVCTVPAVAAGNEHAYGVYTLRVPQRDRVRAVLNERGIPTGVYYPRCCHQQPVYADLGYADGAFPVAEAACAEVLSLPMHPYMSGAQTDAVVAAVRDAIAVAAG